MNKVETAVEALWHVASSRLLSDEEKERITKQLASFINKDGYLVTKSSETRSQLENKEIAVRKMNGLIAKGLIVPKKRKKTKPSKEAVQKRLESKKRLAFKKQQRKRPPLD